MLSLSLVSQPAHAYWAYALIGMGLGAIAGGFIGAGQGYKSAAGSADCRASQPDCSSMEVGDEFVGGLIGAMIGAGVGALVGGVWPHSGGKKASLDLDLMQPYVKAEDPYPKLIMADLTYPLPAEVSLQR